jgi:pimeloyl-ACP methyl ester carboxylesterase
VGILRLKMKTRAINALRDYPDRLFRRVLVAGGFKSLYLSTKIGRHHVYRYKGSGQLPPLVILHGGGDSAGTYMPIMLQLRRSFSEIIAVESVGHGLSGESTQTYTFEAHYQSMNEVLDSLIDSRRPAVMAGNSLGGLTAMKYAIHAPERVRGLFLLSPMGAPMTDEALKDLYGIFTPKNLDGVDLFIDRIYDQLPGVKRAFVRRLTFAWITRQAIQDLVHDTTTEDGISAAELREIRQPVHMICGRSDRIMTPNAIGFFKDNISNLEVSRPNALGHCPHLENPKLVMKELLGFVNGIRPAGT